MRENFAQVPASLIAAKRPAALQVYCVLDRMAKPDGSLFAGLRDLATKTGLSGRTIIREKRWLEAEGYLRCVRVGHGHLASDYSLPFRVNGDTRATLKPETAGETCHEGNANGDTKATRGVTPGKHNDTPITIALNESIPVSKKPGRRKAADPEVEARVAQVFKGLGERRDKPFANREREAQAIRWMVTNGFEPDTILACYDAMAADPWWQDNGPVYAWNVQKKIPAFGKERRNGSATHNQPMDRGRPSPFRGIGA